MSYAWNKLRLAVHCLAAAGSQRERLAAAIAEHVACLRPKDLPSTWRPEFTSVIGRLGLELKPVRKQAASIRRTVDALSDEEVSGMIHCILRLYDAVTRYQPIQTAEELSESTATPHPLSKSSVMDPSKKILTKPMICPLEGGMPAAR